MGDRTSVTSTTVALPYVERGDRSRPAAVFLHGFCDHWRSYEPVLAHLPPELRAFALTQRGHGGASQPSAGYSVADLAADVLAFLSAVEVERGVLVGHSMGAAAALQAALDAPDRVAGLVLAPGFAKARGQPGFEELVAAVHGLTDPVDPAFAAMLQEQAREEHLPPRLFEAMVEHTLAMPTYVLRALVDGLHAFDIETRLSLVSAPVLLIWGAQDPILGRTTQGRLLQGLAEVEWRVYRDGGHTPHWDDPGRFAADVARFVAGVRGPYARP